MNNPYNYQQPANSDYLSSPIYSSMNTTPETGSMFQRSPIYDPYHTSPYYAYINQEMPGYPDSYSPLPPSAYDAYSEYNWEDTKVLSVEVDVDSTVSELQAVFGQYNGHCCYQVTATGSFYVTVTFPNGQSAHAAYDRFQDSVINGENIHLGTPSSPEQSPYYPPYGRSLSENGLLQQTALAKLPSPIGPKKSESFRSYSQVASPLSSTSVWTDGMFVHSETSSTMSPPSSPQRSHIPPAIVKNDSDYFYQQSPQIAGLGRDLPPVSPTVGPIGSPIIKNCTSSDPIDHSLTPDKSTPTHKPPLAPHPVGSSNPDHPPLHRKGSTDHVGGSITASGRVRTTRSEIDPASFSLNLDRVENGEDKRTTLMVRNIPNKYKPKMLLTEIDEKYRGLYDFFYLPIDFKNRCNVGYAFINFIHSITVADFYRDFNNRKWNKFNSDKICEVRYGRIQGQLELISHFRNSSVMTVDEEYRPLLFSTEGEPQSFPPEFYGSKSKRPYH